LFGAPAPAILAGMLDERRIPTATRDEPAAGRDRRAAEIAAEAWGIVTAAELRECGLTSNAISARKRIGWLHQLYRGVYALGHPNPPWEGRLLAAVKACGPDALLSHYSAAELWGFVDRLDRLPDVTVGASGSRNRRGIRIHRSESLALEDRRVHAAIPVTSPARTLLDLASMLDEHRVRRAVRRAQGLGRVTLRQLGRVLDRYPRRRGSGVVRAAIGAGAAPTRSERESDVLDLIIDGGLAHPDVNRPLLIGGRRVIPDFRWPKQHLVLEVDSTAWHENPLARADDRERQALLEAYGERVVRVHWREAILRPARTLRQLAAAGAPIADERRFPTASR
jgi:very-short-patch-repair endonuclease